MARKLRIAYPGALYHVINRGNYRADIFESDAAKKAFLTTLWEAADKANWRIHAYVIMRNHYHIALETPDGTLVEGMRWLQSTFAHRFNRFRKESGHVFQGRYQAIVVQDFAHLATVVNYIHLNPVRAQIVAPADAATYPWSSLALLPSPTRPPRLDLSTGLKGAGSLTDSPDGQRTYLDYLTWLATADAKQKELEFARLSRGWVIGGRDFVKALAQDHKEQWAQTSAFEQDAHAAREAAWEQILATHLKTLGCDAEAAKRDRKSAAWKVAIAATMRRDTTATNVWLTEQLNMGAADGVSRYVAEARRGSRPEATKLIDLLAKPSASPAAPESHNIILHID
ncbi:MAG: hypothetical protein RL376_679 [Verrucomicrobiota bacterium]|jgi:REP element-mobilizing transposase RayT